MTGREIRLGRLFDGSRNAVVIAVDHGEFDGPISGMVNLPETVGKIEPEVSAILLSPGMLAHCGAAFCRKGAPLAMVRLNWSTVYAFHWGYNEAATVPAMSPSEAAAAGADVALVSLTLRTGSEERDARNVEVYCRLAAEAHALGMPVVGEVFPTRTGEIDGEELHDQVLRGCRIVAELGADLVKTFHTKRFREVTAGCPVPVLGLGAEKTPTQLDALALAQRIVRDGGRGVVFGRNAIQVPDPAAFQRALLAVVRDGADTREAAERHGLRDV